MSIPNTKYQILNTEISNAYFVGIKGVGMTGFAQILHARGVRVSGSDTNEKFFTDEVLNRLGISFVEGFNAENLPEGTDIVITSPAYVNSDNPELAEAHTRHIPITTWQEALAELFNAQRGIAVAGTHGKSTTVAMLGLILEHAGLDPTVVVGSRVNQWHSNARAGASDLFVVEADEYRDTFLQYHPKMIVLTNVDYDHPDYFPTRESYAMSFKRFIDRVDIENLIRGEGIAEHFALNVPGEYNQQNANLAYRAALKLGVSETVAREALESFAGIARRFEHYGTAEGAELYDDYAHHPSEIKALLKAAREKFPRKKIIVLFQPHTFSRTKGLFNEFTKAFIDADEVLILKTYGSAREGGPAPRRSGLRPREAGKDEWGKKLASALKAPYRATHQEAAAALKEKLADDIVLFTVGAGDGWQVLKLLMS